MARLQFGQLKEAWKGEASDFTPLLSEQLDIIGSVLGLDLLSVGKAEVPSAGGRRIDIVAKDAEGTELVIENQYGKADHDHLTRGLAYAVARGARGLIVIAEEHRDEFRAVAEYLNTLAEKDEEHGIAVWLVEVAAVRIGDSPWAPLFTPVVSPNAFVAKVSSTASHSEDIPASLEEFYKTFADEEVRSATQQIVTKWLQAGHRYRLGKGHVVLSAEGPAVSGVRTVVAITNDGRVLVPYSSYAGQNSGIPVDALTTDSFRAQTDVLFGFNGSEKQARTAPGWLQPDRVESLMAFCSKVAAAYQEAVQVSANGA